MTGERPGSIPEREDGVGPALPTEPDQRSLPLDYFDGPPVGPELDALIEALLLTASEPTTLDDLARGAGVALDDAAAALAQIEQSSDRGWVIQRHQGKVQLATAPRFARQVRRFLGLDRETRLSPAALETVAIIAYQQPVTRAEIEAVRGVDCSGVLSTLYARGLIDAVGRLPSVGNPIQYGSTPDFLRHFGLRSLDDLPPLGHVDGRDVATALTAAVAAADLDRDQSIRPEVEE